MNKLILIIVLVLSSCAAAVEKKVESISKTQTGKASWYSTSCNGGSRTASGIKLKNHEMTAAHKTLPFGSKVRVTNLNNGKSEIVKIIDRGPYVKGRVIDVSVGAAESLGFKGKGVTNVKLEVLND